MVVADQLATDNAGALRSAVEKALAYINLGLELRSGGNIEKAEEIVRGNFLEHLFRFSQSRVAGIRARLQSLVNNGWLRQCPAGIKCLDGEWFYAAEELLAKTPRIGNSAPDEEASGETAVFDFFRTPRDLVRGNHVVDVITRAGDLYEALHADPKELGARLWAEGQVHVLEDITLGVMVLTAAANFLISGKWVVEPLSHASWPDVFPLLQPPEVERAVKGWVNSILPGPEEKALAEKYLVPVLREYHLDMQPFSAQSPPDAHLVKFFMFSE